MVAATGAGLRVGLSFYNITSAVIAAASIAATLPNPVESVSGFDYNLAWTTAPIALTWPAGSFVNVSQIYLSNPVAIPVDTAHDYYITVYLDPTNAALSPYNTTGGSLWASTGGYAGGNHTADADATTLITISGEQIFAQVIIA